MDSICLIAIGFLIYGPVMLIGVHALDLAPKKAAGTAAGFTGFFGYFFGTALFANIGLGYVVQNLGWNWNFIVLLVACALGVHLYWIHGKGRTISSETSKTIITLFKNHNYD